MIILITLVCVSVSLYVPQSEREEFDDDILDSLFSLAPCDFTLNICEIQTLTCDKLFKNRAANSYTNQV